MRNNADIQKLYMQVAAMFHYKEQLLPRVEPKAPGNKPYTEAAEEAVVGALAVHFDCCLDMYADEIHNHAIATLAPDQLMEQLLLSCGKDYADDPETLKSDKDALWAFVEKL